MKLTDIFEFKQTTTSNTEVNYNRLIMHLNDIHSIAVSLEKKFPSTDVPTEIRNAARQIIEKITDHAQEAVESAINGDFSQFDGIFSNSYVFKMATQITENDIKDAMDDLTALFMDRKHVIEYALEEWRDIKETIKEHIRQIIQSDLLEKTKGPDITDFISTVSTLSIFSILGGAIVAAITGEMIDTMVKLLSTISDTAEISLKILLLIGLIREATKLSITTAKQLGWMKSNLK